MYYTPIVIERTSFGERSYDIYSRLLKDRIILLCGEIQDSLANSIVAQLLFLAAEDSEKEIYLYINSIGGSVTAGMAIHDTMRLIAPRFRQSASGWRRRWRPSSSQAARGKRFALPNSEILIHALGAPGQATEIQIAAKHIVRTRERLNKLLAKYTGKSIEQINNDTDRDNYMFAEEALEYGIIDAILEKEPQKK